MPISEWPSHEKPREKLLYQGAASLSDAELLAIFFRNGIKGKTALDLARLALREFGGLRPLLNAELTDFCRLAGLGVVKYVQLQASVEMVRRHLHEGLQCQGVLHSPSETAHYLLARMRDFQHEIFACLFLDSRNRILAYEELFQGTIHSTVVHPRILIKRALAHNAAGIILAHNHPSGNASPSEADKQITHQLQKIFDLLDIRLLDHVIVGDGETYSFNKEGLLV